MTVADGKRISIEYTLRLEDLSEVESNVGEEPLEYTHGAHEIIPGLEQGLLGLDVGGARRVTVPPELGYGPVDPEAFQEVEKSAVPEDAWWAGAPLLARDAEGRSRELRVHEVRQTTVVVDFNHPLAGKTLIFDVRILGIA